MKYLFLFLLIVFTGVAKAQIISGVDFDAIKKDVTNSGQNNYGLLAKKIHDKDTSLTADNYKHLYYGQIFQSGYAPYTTRRHADDGMKLLAKNDVAGAERVIDSCLVANPANLDALYYKSYLLFTKGQKDEATVYIKYFRGLLTALIASGNGQTDKTAMVVTSVPDEYQVLKIFKGKMVSQSLTPSQCDLITFEREGIPGQNKIYFNVEKPLAAMTQMLKQ